MAEVTDGPSRCPELSVVMPCLNEHETVGGCVRKAWSTLQANGINGEVIVADNGSTDGSREQASAEGASVVDVAAPGYGSALAGGIAAARGDYVIMADADASYDFGEIPSFLARMREGCDIVQGCRLPSGGGRIEPHAMPWLHRWIGNPGLSWLARVMFSTPFHDVYCGMRGFRKDYYNRLGLKAEGMEFATEMIIKSALFGGRTSEVPITLWPDGRVSRRPHLRTFRDGWRTVRLFLIYSPRWLFWYPGLFLIALGFLGYAVAAPGLRIAGVVLDVHTLLVASLLMMVGFQACCFAIVTTAYSVTHGYRPPSPRVTRFFRVATLERCVVFSAMLILFGVLMIAIPTTRWVATAFGPLDYAGSMRMVVPGVTAIAIGTLAVFSAFLNAVVGTRR